MRIAMQEVIIVGIALGFTGLLLLLRSWIFRRPAGKSHLVHIMNRVGDSDGGRDLDADDEWPSVIGEESSTSKVKELSREERLQLLRTRYLVEFLIRQRRNRQRRALYGAKERH